jgi:hypothetical protein
MRKTGVHFIVVGVRAVWLLAVRSVDNCQTCESGCEVPIFLRVRDPAVVVKKPSSSHKAEWVRYWIPEN